MVNRAEAFRQGAPPSSSGHAKHRKNHRLATTVRSLTPDPGAFCRAGRRERIGSRRPGSQRAGHRDFDAVGVDRRDGAARTASNGSRHRPKAFGPSHGEPADCGPEANRVAANSVSYIRGPSLTSMSHSRNGVTASLARGPAGACLQTLPDHGQASRRPHTIDSLTTSRRSTEGPRPAFATTSRTIPRSSAQAEPSRCRRLGNGLPSQIPAPACQSSLRARLTSTGWKTPWARS